MAGKGSRRGDVQLSKTARASVGDKGSAATAEWSKFHCNACSTPIRVKEMVVIREVSTRGNTVNHYHTACAGLPGA